MAQEQSKAERIKDAKQTLKIVFLTLPIWPICALFGFGPIGLNLCCLSTVLGLVVQVRSELRPYRWFWMLLIGVAVVHIPLVLWAPWNGKRFFGIQMKPFLFADYALVYFIVYVGEKVFLNKNDNVDEHTDHPGSLLN